MRTGSQDRSWGVEVGDRTQTSHDERNREKDGWEVGSCAFIITSLSLNLIILCIFLKPEQKRVVSYFMEMNVDLMI